MIANALPRPLTAGSVDNAILRADGTGGTILQSSGLIVNDAVVPYSVTGDAATDVITATGHIYTANQTVIFSAITGGAGLSANTVYFVRNPSGNTFQLSTTSGGAAINFTTNITAGSIIAIQANVAISQNSTETNSSLVLTPKGTGALIAGPKPDGTATGGNARGARAVDLQLSRSAAGQVSGGDNCLIASGSGNTISTGGLQNAICGGSSNSISGTNCYDSFIGGGNNNSIAVGSFRSVIGGGSSNAIQNVSSDSFIGGGSSNQIQSSNSFSSFIGGGANNTILAQLGVIAGGGGSGFGNRVTSFLGAILGGRDALADRTGQQSHSSGKFSAQGDAQRARFVLRCKTTTNAAVEMALDGATTYLTIPSGKVIFMNIKVVGTKSDGSAVATYERQYAVKNVAATSSQVYAPITIGTDNAAGTSLEVATVDAGDYVRIRPTGIVSETWRWVASVDAVEVAYGT